MLRHSLAFLLVHFLIISSTYSQTASDSLVASHVKPIYTPIIAFTKSNIISTLSLNNESLDKIETTKIHSPSMAHTAFFCKLEDKLSKNAKFPIRMRLGDIRYVDVMEGKRTELVPSK